MKIIFLDIDGVLTSPRTGYMNWDIYATSFLKWICEETNTKIVISSTWRCNRDRKFFSDIFGEDVIHVDWRTTIDLMNFDLKCRGDEIQLWLDLHPEVEKYLILDDDSDMLENQKLNMLNTNPFNGIMFDDMLIICDFLAPNEKFIPNMNLRTLVQHPNMFIKK